MCDQEKVDKLTSLLKTLAEALEKDCNGFISGDISCSDYRKDALASLKKEGIL